MGRGALVLAGGRGVRIGGNKPFIVLRGKPLLLHVLEKARRLADEVVLVISRRDEPAKYERLTPGGVKLVQDPLDIQSPLVGIMAGGAALSAEYAMVLPTDAPFINSQVVDMLFREAASHDAAIPIWPEGRLEPLHAVYRPKPAAAAARAALIAGQLSNWDMVRRLRDVKFVSVEAVRELDGRLLTFFNINTREELAEAERIASELSGDP